MVAPPYLEPSSEPSLRFCLRQDTCSMLFPSVALHNCSQECSGELRYVLSQALSLEASLSVATVVVTASVSALAIAKLAGHGRGTLGGHISGYLGFSHFNLSQTGITAFYIHGKDIARCPGGRGKKNPLRSVTENFRN